MHLSKSLFSVYVVNLCVSVRLMLNAETGEAPKLWPLASSLWHHPAGSCQP